MNLSEKPPHQDASLPIEYHIGEEEPLTEAILHAVETATDEQLLPRPATTDAHLAAPPLYDVIDVDALASLSAKSATNDADWRVAFPYCGCEVTITSSDTVLVEKPSNADRKD